MASLSKEYAQKNTFWRRWAAFYILLILFFGSWGVQFVSQLRAEQNEARQHGQELQMNDFWPRFWASTAENWQSEWLQLATQALLIAGFSEYIFRKGDEEHYKTQLMIEELQRQLHQSRAPKGRK